MTIHVYRARHGYANGFTFSPAEPEEFYVHRGFGTTPGEDVWDCLGTIDEFIAMLESELPREARIPEKERGFTPSEQSEKGSFDIHWVEENCIEYWHEG